MRELIYRRCFVFIFYFLSCYAPLFASVILLFPPAVSWAELTLPSSTKINLGPVRGDSAGANPLAPSSQDRTSVDEICPKSRREMQEATDLQRHYCPERDRKSHGFVVTFKKPDDIPEEVLGILGKTRKQVREFLCGTAKDCEGYFLINCANDTFFCGAMPFVYRGDDAGYTLGASVETGWTCRRAEHDNLEVRKKCSIQYDTKAFTQWNQGDRTQKMREVSVLKALVEVEKKRKKQWGRFDGSATSSTTFAIGVESVNATGQGWTLGAGQLQSAGHALGNQLFGWDKPTNNSTREPYGHRSGPFLEVGKGFRTSVQFSSDFEASIYANGSVKLANRQISFTKDGIVGNSNVTARAGVNLRLNKVQVDAEGRAVYRSGGHQTLAVKVCGQRYKPRSCAFRICVEYFFKDDPGHYGYTDRDRERDIITHIGLKCPIR